MAAMDTWLHAALARQLNQRETLLAGGAAHVGWKLGMGESERRGGDPVIGYLTTATERQPGGSCEVRGLASPHADVEVAIELACDIPPDADAAAAARAIRGWAAALELCDLGNVRADAEEIVATNVFHRAFAIGPLRGSAPDRPVGRVFADGIELDAAAAAADHGAQLVRVARLLDAFGLRLRSGDRLIKGSVVQVPVGAGQQVTAELDGLGRVALHLQ
jgi:2-keto-4-pentenoate hydratase